MQLNCTVEIRGQQAPIDRASRFRKAFPTREERARVLAEQGMVHHQSGGHYWVESVSARLKGVTGQGHMVCLDGERASCTCPDWAERLRSAGHACQHILAARLVARQAQQTQQAQEVPALAVA